MCGELSGVVWGVLGGVCGVLWGVLGGVVWVSCLLCYVRDCISAPAAVLGVLQTVLQVCCCYLLQASKWLYHLIEEVSGTMQ